MSKKFMKIMQDHYEDENTNSTSWFWTLLPLVTFTVLMIVLAIFKG